MLKNLPYSSIVLTTHRMDEAESLCDNIVIMINGKFVCYGSPGQLKSNYGQGYSITMKHVATQQNAIDEYVSRMIPFLQKGMTRYTEYFDSASKQQVLETSYEYKPQYETTDG